MTTVNNPELIDSSINSLNVKKQASKTYNRLGLSLVIFLAGQIILPSAIAFPLVHFFPSLAETGLFGMPLVYFCMYIIAFPLMLLLLKKLPNTNAQPIAPQNAPINIKQVLLLFPFGYAVLNILGIAIALLEAAMGTSATVTTQDIVSGGVPLWATFTLGVFVAPFMEEVVFRNLTYKKASGFGKTPYIIWSAVMFGLFHLNFGQSIYAAVLGVVLAIVMLKTGSLKTVALIHMLINFSGGIGIGSVALSTNNEIIIIAYTVFVYVLMAVGVVCGVILLRKKALSVEECALPEKTVKTRVAFLNVGTILFVAACVAIIILGFFM